MVIVTDKLRSYGSAHRTLASRTAPITARRTRMSRCDDENERCKASNRRNLLSASSLFMRRSTIRSTFNGICLAGRRIDGFEPLHTNPGAMQQLQQHKLAI